MHARNVIVATDDVYTRSWLDNGIGGLDVAITHVPVSEYAAQLMDDRCELVIVDAARAAGGEIVAEAEAAAARGADVRLLLVVEPEELKRVRMPVRVPADFVVRSAPEAEVAARVRRLLWPGEEPQAQDLVRIDDLTLNLATYQAYLRDEPLEFTYLEYALFVFLVTHPNRVYSREVLLGRVWGTDYFGGARTVDVHVRRVRAKVGPELARRLETVRNVGYLWRG